MKKKKRKDEEKEEEEEKVEEKNRTEDPDRCQYLPDTRTISVFFSAFSKSSAL